MNRVERWGANVTSVAVAAVFVPLAALSAATSGPPQSQEASAAQVVTWGVVLATPWVFAALGSARWRRRRARQLHDPGPQPAGHTTPV